MTKLRSSRLAQALLQTAGDMRRADLLDAATHKKITLRHLSDAPTQTVPPLTGDEIRALRERARLSQAVFARYLNLTVSTVSQLERGARQATGPALVLLNVIRHHGIEAIMARE